MLNLTNLVTMAVSGNWLQEVSGDDGISPWVVGILALDRVVEIMTELWCLAANYKTSARTMESPHGWQGLQNWVESLAFWRDPIQNAALERFCVVTPSSGYPFAKLHNKTVWMCHGMKLTKPAISVKSSSDSVMICSSRLGTMFNNALNTVCSWHSLGGKVSKLSWRNLKFAHSVVKFLSMSSDRSTSWMTLYVSKA
jgi:hypothetical protein